MSDSKTTLAQISTFLALRHPGLLADLSALEGNSASNPDETLQQLINFFGLNFHQKLASLVIERVRRDLSNAIAETFNWVIKYGPFAGMRLLRSSWWGEGDKASIVFGLYEQEVAKELLDLSKKFKTFIDIGAADGYYGVGMVCCGYVEKSICYEISEAGQKVIAELAVLNNCSDRVKVRAEAKKNFLAEVTAAGEPNALILIDIEGAEFDLLDDAQLEQIRNCAVIVEIHDFIVSDGKSKYENFLERCEKHFDLKRVTTTNRDLSIFPELDTFSDHARWLLASEGRGQRMHWLIMTPKNL
jgi:hypothetical protein